MSRRSHRAMRALVAVLAAGLLVAAVLVRFDRFPRAPVSTEAVDMAVDGPGQPRSFAGDAARAIPGQEPPPPPAAGPDATPADLAYLRGRRLLVPVAGVRAADLPDSFDEARSEGRRHEALDILAPRGTPVLSADHGRIARIDTSERGGLSLYATDPSGRFVYYYAHLDRYHPRLRDGMPLARGDTLGYVGITGNVPPGTPHLHFGISVLGDSTRWWDGAPINPWPLLADTR